MRKFVSQRAVRANVPLLIALIGPSGGGKTYSALRLATGIQRVQPGTIYGISTEGNRMLEYAEKFTFTHVPFEAPFGPLDYLAALQQCQSEGAKTIIVDSMSHEHEGPGGVLDQADREVLTKLKRKNIDPDSDAGWHEAQKLKRSAWIKPKAERGKLIQGLLQLRVNVVMCFRAKEGTDQVKNNGKTEIKKLGWLPIGGDAFWYEMTARALLLPGANGVPEWRQNNLLDGERIAARRPEQFASILRDGAQLNEDMGEQMARWATGNGPSVSNVELDAAAIMTKVNACATREELQATSKEAGALPWSDAQRKAIKATVDARAAALKGNQ